MGSRDRMPPNLRRPLPGPGGLHPDAFFPEPRPGPFFDVLPPPEIMEQNLARQHMEMQKLVMENERLAATHSILRKELVGAQQELQRLHAHVGAAKAEKEQQMAMLLDKMAKMEADLQSFEPMKVELQKSRIEADNLNANRQELISKAQQLTQDLERSHVDAKQVPALLSELEGLRREYQNCRVAYDHEKKLYHEHLESLQVMERNYISMSREVEKLRAELGGISGNAVHKSNDPHGPPNAYNDVYGTSQGRGTPRSGASPYGGRGPPQYDGQRGPSHNNPKTANYDASGGPGYDAAARESGYNPRGPTHETNRAGSSDAAGYDAPRGAAGYDASRGAGYNAPGAGYDYRRGANAYDAPQGVGYDGSRGSAGYEYDAMRAGAGYEYPRNAGYNDPRGAQALGYDAPKPSGHAAAGGGGQNAAGTGMPRASGGEYDALRGSGGGRQPAYAAAAYGQIQNQNLPVEVPYRGGSAQRQ